ncbi:MAG: family 78 glycoside hydrolase catalytic domain, partial [Limosilactobacillus fermentum]|nr:family 78 glycoside hydrolase catalytic domain [Limosilactobacillus fermentum]
MTITTLQINHQTAPIGFDLSNLRVDFSVDAASFDHPTKALAVWTNDQAHPVYQVGPVTFDNNYFDLSDLALTPRTRYHVAVTVVNGNEETSATTFFETGKMDEAFQANWIANDNKDLQNTLFKREFNLGQEVSTARLYITGLGLYEASLNGDKIGNEYLTPGVTAYDQLVQVQSYDVTDQLRQGDNKLLVSTADGWYKGNYGFDGGQDKLYGDQHRIIAELHVTLADGTTLQINTDKQWETTQGPVTKSAIYYGEDYDAQFEITGWQPVTVLNSTKNVLKDRLSLPLTVQETITPTEIITTPAGETVIDFGQNQAGWPEFYCDEPAGTKITLQASEILQEGNFYRGNLRDARAAFTYVSDGKAKWVRPHFTYYGYRYMKITGNTKPVEIKNFRAAVIYSQMETTGDIETTNPLVNRLFQNIQWGQKSNFFDVPTDCPQRDERLGWTGDANIFSNTAALNMNVFAFFKKYARDMAIEQNDHGGMLTMYAPKMNSDDGGAAVWGDAATFIPWNMYQDYGDPAILHQNYPEMKAWVDWITSQTTTPNLWTDGFQFGDWIALDGENPALPTGKTNEDYIASVYYYASSLIVSQTAALLGHDDDAKQYGEQAANIKQAIQREYITATGRVAIDTQTAYALALYFNLVSDDLKPRVTADLVARLGKDDDHLKTGF